jgi:hypothetical protein
MWTNLNKIIGKCNNSNIDVELMRNFPQDTADSLCRKINNNFANIVPNLHRVNNTNNTSKRTQYMNSQQQRVKDTIFLQKSTPEDVAKIIHEVNNKNSTGKDGVMMKHIISSVNNSSIAISKLINSIIDNEVWPEKLKIQVLRPIYKKGSKKNLDNYRPISLLSNINKIIEKFLAKQILGFLNKHEIITNKQFGFRQNKGTTDALKYVNEVTSKALNNGFYVKAVLVDLQKAFDTIDHKKLISKCEGIGLRGKCGSLLKSYMMDRKACTKLKESYSDYKKIDFGVPQGSVLGPLLFNIYINDIILTVKNCEIVLFADDIFLVSVNKNKDIMEFNLQTDFNNLNLWFKENDLFISDSKTCCLPISSPHRKYEPRKLTIHTDKCKVSNNCDYVCVPVQSVVDTKYLGFYIDKYWKHSQHIFTLIKKLRQMMPTLYKIKPLLNDRNKLIVFDALVTSHIRYGIEIYGFAAEYLIERLQKTLNKILKIFFNKNGIYKSSHKLMKEYGILTVKNLRDYIIILKHYFNNDYKFKDNLKTKYLRDTTVKFKIPIIKNNYGLKSKEYHIPFIFNKLPLELINLNNYSQIKTRIKRWLLDN